MAITGGSSLGAATAAAPGNNVAATTVVCATRIFRKERARSSGVTRPTERNKRRALHQTAMAAGPSPNQVAMPILASTNPSLVLATSTPTAPSRTAAPPNHYTRSGYHKCTQASRCIKPYKAVVPILTIMDTPSPTATSCLTTTPSSAAVLASISTLNFGSTQSYQVASPCSGGRTIAVRATVFKMDRSRAGTTTRTAERKKKRALLQTSVLRIQAATPGPTASAIPATYTTSLWNPVVALSMPVAFSWVDEMNPPNTPSFDVVLTLAATDKPKTTNEPSLGAATTAAPGDDIAPTAVVRAARFKKERATASGATQVAERKKRRAFHQMGTAVGPAPNQAAMPIPAATSPPSLELETSMNAAPSQTAAPSLDIILVPAATSVPKPAAASSPTKSNRHIKPGFRTKLSCTSILSSGSTQSYKEASPCSGGRPITVCAMAFKKDRSRAGAATRAAEKNKKRALLQTFVLPIQTAASSPTAKAIPATRSSWNPVIAPSMPIAFSQVDEMCPPITATLMLCLHGLPWTSPKLLMCPLLRAMRYQETQKT
uniref:Uncharacterized protein n=1 Tax=Oryza punctata TaxID=4537 RepID=A0A0E0MLU5_ORYPU